MCNLPFTGQSPSLWKMHVKNAKKKMFVLNFITLMCIDLVKVHINTSIGILSLLPWEGYFFQLYQTTPEELTYGR